MKTTLIVLTLFIVMVIACKFGYQTEQSIYGVIQAACIFGMGAVLVNKIKLV